MKERMIELNKTIHGSRKQRVPVVSEIGSKIWSIGIFHVRAFGVFLFRFGRQKIRKNKSASALWNS